VHVVLKNAGSDTHLSISSASALAGVPTSSGECSVTVESKSPHWRARLFNLAWYRGLTIKRVIRGWRSPCESVQP
jgi:hypothetical protein